MLKNCLTGALTLSVFLSIPVLAHHGHNHHESPVIQPPPVAVVEPPPVAQTAPPTVGFQLPLIAPPSTILPTDIAGIHSGPDASKFQQIPSSLPLTKEALAALSAPDARYLFTGKWLLFSANYSALVTSTPYKPVTILTNDTSFKFGKVEHIERHPPKLNEPAFMPTSQARFAKVSDEHLSLQHGAVLVRAGNRPVFISTEVKGERVSARIAGGSLIMVSAFDDKATVLNLTDKCCGALVLYVPSTQGNKHHSVVMKPGQIAEVYAPGDKPISNLVATRIDRNQRIGHDYGLLVSQCHYVRALKKFNLTPVLARDDLERVLKTAAAIAYLRR